MSTMRSVPLGREPGAAEIDSFAGLTDRPLLVVGNGPSSAMPPYHRIPADVVVFRMNWFFLESNYHFGDRVDAWFSAVPHEKLETLLQDEIRTGRYDVRRVLSPMRHAAHRDGDRYGLEPLTDVTELDSWSIPARSPRLARHFMSRPGLPTTGMQALAFGLGVGFREVYLAGIDLYESKDARYGYTMPQVAELGLEAKDATPGYEAAHGLDSDIAFLRSCLAEYPDATVRSVSQSEVLHLYVRPAEDLVDRPHLEPGEEASVGSTKDTVELVLPAAHGAHALTVPRVKGPLWKEVDGRRCAYVTVVSGAYHHGARALANSLRRVTDVPLVALCTPDADKAALAASGILTLDVPPIVNPVLAANAGRRRRQKVQERFAATYTKLHVFRLDLLDRAVYVDSDAVVKQNIDDLFAGDDFAAVPDAGLDLPNPHVFNSGVFAFTPSYGMFEQMMSRLRTTPSYDGGDQGFLNVFFDSWRALGPEDNTTKRIASHHPELFHDEDVRVLHYVGKKPWEPADDPRYDALDLEWLDYLTDTEKNELIRDLRRRTDLTTAPPAPPAEVLRTAKEHLAAGQADPAVRLLEDTARKRRLTATEQRQLAVAQLRLGRRRDALRTLERTTGPVAALAVGSGVAAQYYRSRRG
ncbi:hypothetical protein LEP48_05255 [Isoptericola sp. NEAU-Y5]|uniref:Glycosyl transferase family 8 n=1 Tax=Isoptericola luteus TaxID=2879484 RepID=A0ABS7ZG28_9MICO|nr:glycosyltransferase [Isoptericola sp. NEAU-Y5]MCA5892760.1 hypothetical protein [Isoptericola sp. NEAU-Y5]